MSQVKCMAPDCENPAKWRMVLDLGDNAEMVEMVCVLHPDFGIEILAEYAAGDGIPDPEIKVTHAAIGEKEQGEVTDLFCALKKEWQEDTMFSSSLREIVLHPAYQRIIGLGPRALPLIFDQLRRNPPTHWFWALVAIVGEDPAIESHTLREAASLWLQWAARHGY